MISLRKAFKGLYRLCECNCGYLIKIINKQGKVRRFKNGHQNLRQNNANWKGGMSINKLKYIFILRPHHKYSHKRYVRLHRYRMELMLGRYLTKEEVVHHRDGNPENNEEDNLMLFPNHSEHLNYERTKDTSDRWCVKCGDKTYINKKGHPQWFGNKIDGFKCRKCHRRKLTLIKI